MFPIEVIDKTGMVYSISICEPNRFHIDSLNGMYYKRYFHDCWQLEVDKNGYYQTPPEVREVIDRLLENRAFW